MDISKIRSKRRCTLYPSNALLDKKKAVTDKQSVEVVKHFEPNNEAIRNSDQSDDLPYFAPEEDEEKKIVEGIKFRLSRVQTEDEQKQTISTVKKTSTDKKRYPPKGRPKRPSSFASSASNQSKKCEPSKKFHSSKQPLTNKGNNANQSVGKNRYIEVSDNKKGNFSMPTAQDQKPYSLVTASYIENLKDEIRTIASKNNDQLTKTANELKNEINLFRKCVRTNVKVCVKKDKDMPPIMKVHISRPQEYSPPPGNSPQKNMSRSTQSEDTAENAINTDTINSNVKPPLNNSVVPERKDRIRSCIKKYDLEVAESPENDNYSKISEQINNVNYDISSSLKSSDSDSVEILFATRMNLQNFEEDCDTEDESTDNLQQDDIEAKSSASNGTEVDSSDNDVGPPSIIPVLMQAMPNPLDIRCTEDTPPEESCSGCVLVENEAYLNAVNENNKDIETFAKLLAEAQFVLQNISQKVKNVSPRDCECQGKTVDASINNDGLLQLECPKLLSETKLVDKALSACSTNVSKVSVGIQATSKEKEIGDKQNVVIKIPLVDQPCSALSLDVLCCEKLCNAQILCNNEDASTVASTKYELTPTTSASTGITATSGGKGRDNDKNISFQDVASIKDVDQSSTNNKLLTPEDDEISEEVQSFKNMNTIIELSEKENSDDLNMKTQYPSRESCTRNKLTIQIMPSIDIRRGLVTQKIPNIIITANESMPDTEGDQQSNIAYEVVKHVCYTENCKLECQPDTSSVITKPQEYSIKTDKGKENIQDEKAINFNNTVKNLGEICNNSAENYRLSELEPATEIVKTNEVKEDVQKQVLLVIPEKDSSKPQQADTEKTYASVGIQTIFIDVSRDWSETSSLPSYDYQCKRFIPHSSPQLELPRHSIAAVRKYINSAYEDDTNSEQEVFASQSHKYEKKSSTKIPNPVEHLAQYPSERSTKTYVRQIMEKDPHAEDIFKSFQLLDEKSSHNPEHEVDEKALSTMDIDVYKTYVNPKGLKTNVLDTEKTNATTSYHGGERASIGSFLRFKSADYQKRNTLTDTEKVNAATSHHASQKENTTFLKFKDQGVNTVATERLNAATSFSSAEKRSINSERTDHLENKEVNTIEVEKLVAVTSPYSFKRKSSSSLRLRNIYQLENKEVNTEETGKLNASTSYNNTETNSALKVLNQLKNQNIEEQSSESLKLQGTYQLENTVISPKKTSSNSLILFNQFEELNPLNLNTTINSNPIERKQESSRFIVHDSDINGEYNYHNAELSANEPHDTSNTQEQQPPVNNLAPKNDIANNIINEEDQITNDSMAASASVNLKIDEADLESSSHELIFKARPTLFAEQSTPNIASNFLNPTDCDTLSHCSNNTDDIIFEIKSSQLRSYSQNLMRSRNNLLKQSLLSGNEEVNTQEQSLVFPKDRKRTSVSKSNSLDTSSESLDEYIITHDVAIQTSLSNSNIITNMHQLSVQSLSAGVESLKEIGKGNVLNEEEVTSSCCKKLRRNKKKESKNAYTKSNPQDHTNLRTKTSVLRPNAINNTSEATLIPRVISSLELSQQKSVKIEEPQHIYSYGIYYNKSDKGHKKDVAYNKADRDSDNSTNSSNESKLDKITVMTVNIKQPGVIAGRYRNEFINQGHLPSGDSGDCVERATKNDENLYKNKRQLSPVLYKRKDSFHHQKNETEVIDKATSGASSSEATASESDSSRREKLLSDGEIKCKCTASIGEVHRCSPKRNFKSKIPYLKRQSQKLLAREFGDPNLKIKRKTQFYSNWVAYYISKNNHSDSDNTDSQNSNTDSSGQVKK